MRIYAKLAKIQRELIAPKEQKNNFGNYNYRSCEDILKALKPLCDLNNCVVYISNTLESIGGRNYVSAEVNLVDIETGEKITSTAHAREEEAKKGMDGSQITGASSSYARKYALAGLFCIDNEKDSDTGEQPEEKAEIVTIKEQFMDYVKKHYTKAQQEEICAKYNASKLEEITNENITAFFELLKKKKEKNNE